MSCVRSDPQVPYDGAVAMERDVRRLLRGRKGEESVEMDLQITRRENRALRHERPPVRMGVRRLKGLQGHGHAPREGSAGNQGWGRGDFIRRKDLRRRRWTSR